jgi:hypothetical protein
MLGRLRTQVLHTVIPHRFIAADPDRTHHRLVNRAAAGQSRSCPLAPRLPPFLELRDSLLQRQFPPLHPPVLLIRNPLLFRFGFVRDSSFPIFGANFFNQNPLLMFAKGELM